MEYNLTWYLKYFFLLKNYLNLALLNNSKISNIKFKLEKKPSFSAKENLTKYPENYKFRQLKNILDIIIQYSLLFLDICVTSLFSLYKNGVKKKKINIGSLSVLTLFFCCQKRNFLKILNNYHNIKTKKKEENLTLFCDLFCAKKTITSLSRRKLTTYGLILKPIASLH